MNLLAVETSSQVLSVAIKKRGGKLRHATVQGYMKHAENLLPVIDRLLKNEKLKIGDIDAFLIDRGPGSFTGLRIGFATLKGFLAIFPKPCYGSYSLDVIAAAISPFRTSGVCENGHNTKQDLTVCLDARRGKLYTRTYTHKKKGWSSTGPADVLSFEEMLRDTAAGSFVAGDGILKIDARNMTAIPEKDWYPRASTLIELFETKNPLIKKLSRPKDLLPVYLRRSEAEERLSERKK